MTSNIEVMNRGIRCLLDGLGSFETEQFISFIIREKFDYTKWQREHFDQVSLEEFQQAAVQHEKEHPFRRERD